MSMWSLQDDRIITSQSQDVADDVVNCRIKIWDSSTGALLHTLANHSKQVPSLRVVGGIPRVFCLRVVFP